MSATNGSCRIHVAEAIRGNNPQDRMSAMGQKQTLAHVGVMSALPPKADIRSIPAAPGSGTEVVSEVGRAARSSRLELAHRRPGIACVSPLVLQRFVRVC